MSLFILSTTSVPSNKFVSYGTPNDNAGIILTYFDWTWVSCTYKYNAICLEHIVAAFVVPRYGVPIVIFSYDYVSLGYKMYA